MKKTLKKVFALLAIIILPACGSDVKEKIEPSPTQINVSPSKSDTLNLGMCSPKTFNPLINEDETVDEILRLIFEPLIKINDDNTIENKLAQEITFDENYNANIKLKENILWSDGTNLTADDVLYSINQIKSAPQNSIYKYVADNIASYKKISSSELSIQFKNGAYISNYVLDFPIIPKKYFAASQKNNSLPICSGVYKFSSYTEMKNLSLEKNDQYFGQASEFQNINVIILPDANTNIDAFNQKIINQVQTDADKIGKFHGYTKKIPIPTDELEFIFLNPANNLFKIKPLHDAMVNILPLDDIKTTIYSGNLSESIFDSPTDITPLDNTKQIISDYKSQSPLKILVNGENAQRIKAAQLIKKSLNDFGIVATIEKYDFEQYKSAVQNKNFDICIGAFKPSQKFYYKNLFADENILGYKNDNIKEKWLKINSAINKYEFDTAIKNFNAALKNSNLIILGSKINFKIGNFS